MGFLLFQEDFLLEIRVREDPFRSHCDLGTQRLDIWIYLSLQSRETFSSRHCSELPQFLESTRNRTKLLF